MWPWEHLVFGYLLYSLFLRVGGSGPPTDRAAVAVAVATQLPDVVDKPLGWLLAVLPSGRSLGHSLLFVVSVVAVVAWVDRRNRGDRTHDGTGPRNLWPAVAVGALSHLVGDVVYPVLFGKALDARFLLWPVLASEADPVGDVTLHLLSLWTRYVELLASTGGGLLFGLEVLLLGLGVAVWLADGAPGKP